MAIETHDVQCPYCGEPIDVDVELLGDEQRFIEDCRVCCHPIQFQVLTNDIGETEVSASRSE